MTAPDDLEARLRTAVIDELPCEEYTICMRRRHPATCPAYYRVAVLAAVLPLVRERERIECELRKSLELTEASCRELERDRERLDWLDEQTRGSSDPETQEHRLRLDFGWGVQSTLRDAVDAARATETDDD